MFESIFTYGAVFLISIFISSLYKKINDRFTKKIIIILSIALPILLATIRYNVGTDFFGYYDSYTKIKVRCNSIGDILSYYQEPLHVIINLLAYKLFNAYQGFLFLASLIVMYFAFKGILNFKDYISIPFAYFIFFMTFYHISFNGTRQAIAAMIIFFAYKHIINRKFKNYLFYVILAGLFHKSAYFSIFLYWIWMDKGKKEKKFYLIVTIATLAIPILTKIIYYICQYLNIYQKYFVSYDVLTTYGFVLYIVPLVILIILNNKNLLKDESNLQNFFMRMHLLQIPLQIMGNHIAYADRMSLYAMPAQIILAPIFLKRVIKNKSLNTILVIAWYIFYYIIMFILLKANGVYPYKTIFGI